MAEEFKKFEDKVLSDEVRHDEREIDKKRADMNMHVVEEDADKSKFMKELREKEIDHDEKVIERKEQAAARHEEKIKEKRKENQRRRLNHLHTDPYECGPFAVRFFHGNRVESGSVLFSAGIGCKFGNRVRKRTAVLFLKSEQIEKQGP